MPYDDLMQEIRIKRWLVGERYARLEPLARSKVEQRAVRRCRVAFWRRWRRWRHEPMPEGREPEDRRVGSAWARIVLADILSMVRDVEVLAAVELALATGDGRRIRKAARMVRRALDALSAMG